MNFIKNIRLKYKPLIVFAVLAILNAGGIYVLRQLVVDEMADHVMPTQEIVGESAYLTKEIQTEVLEYISTGEAETLEQFSDSSTKLLTIAEQLSALAKNAEESEIYAANEAVALNIVTTGQELIDEHGETLTLLQSFKEASEAKDAAVNLIDRAALAAESGLTAELTTQSLSQIERIQTLTLEYVLGGEDAVRLNLDTERAQFFTNLQALQNVIGGEQSSLAGRLEAVVAASTEIAQVSEQVAASHAETLVLLDELEIMEARAIEIRAGLLGTVEEDVNDLQVTANRVAWAVGLVVQVISMLLGFALARTVVSPILRLSKAVEQLGQGEYDTRVVVTSSDELGSLMHNFNEMAAQMGTTVGALQQRTQVNQAISEVSRRLSTILDPEELTTAVVELLQVTFKYYHAHIYLFDESRKYLVMAGGTGEAGRAMLQNKHQIEAGKGLVGRTAVNNKPTLVPNVAADPNWLPNPLLPETKAEVAVPITLENDVLGVLDIQHNVAGGLDEADVALLTSIANQVAVGLQNARLFDQIQLEKAQMQTVMESLSTPIVISRISTGLVAYVNRALTEAFRLSREELVGQLTPDFYANLDERERFLTGLREQGVVKDFEMLLKRGDGELFWGLASGRIINYEGELAIVASIVDIHARKEAEKLLARQANELSTVAKVSTAAATILDPQELLQQVADLTKSSFDLYHAHIHLLDENSKMLVLTAGAGEVGRKMVAEGRRIPLSAAGSLVASVARNVAGDIRNYVSPEEGFMPHPLLAATRSEMAVPIAIGNQVLGVLDVRSEQLNHFDESDLQTVTTLASQVAVALQNARSYTRSEEALQELQELSRRLTREGWDEFFGQQLDTLAFRYDLNKVSPAEDSESEPETGLIQPLQVQGEPIGELVMSSTEVKEDEAAEIAAAVAERLSAHIENLRLAEQTQNALANTEALFAGSESVVRASSMSEILAALVQTTGLQQLDLASLILFERPWHQNPEAMFLTAHWEKRASTSTLPARTVMLVSEFPALKQVIMHDYFYAKDVESDPRLDENTVSVYREFGIKTAFAIPLAVGDQIIGFITASSHQSVPFDEGAIRRITSLVGQAAVVAQSLRLFEDAQDRAQREQMLREMTTRIHAALDAETILRTAAEEIGQMLGLEGYVSLAAADSNGTNGHESVAKSRN
ncbi:MAG: GAF domain-containing protein [Anaerolineaceae bacterium]|nr:GAF domain-containing protein [Anaerolineaceae bacterium]